MEFVIFAMCFEPLFVIIFLQPMKEFEHVFRKSFEGRNGFVGRRKYYFFHRTFSAWLLPSFCAALGVEIALRDSFALSPHVCGGNLLTILLNKLCCVAHAGHVTSPQPRCLRQYQANAWPFLFRAIE